MTDRLTVLLAVVLAACGSKDGDTAETETGEWCAIVEAGEECPDADAARDAYIGRQTCETPVRVVTGIVEFIERRDEVPAYGWYDTGNTQDSCCYQVEFEVKRNEGCTPGRPLGEAAPTALADRVASDWVVGSSPSLHGLSDADRARLAAHWQRAGLVEHASVASFARFALDLVSLGAPADLVAAAHEAALDEVRHAQRSLALAAAYAGHVVSPGPLPDARRPSGCDSLASLAVATFREGCVGETLAAAVAAHQRDRATDPVVRALLTDIADDEARHAALAWRTVRWALAAGGPEVARAVEEAWHAVEPPWATDTAALPGHGMVGPAAEAAVMRTALLRVVGPAVRTLLRGSGRYPLDLGYG